MNFIAHLRFALREEYEFIKASNIEKKMQKSPRIDFY